MSAGDAFEVEGVITAVLSHRTARVRLANGHELFGFVPGRGAGVALVAGGRVRVRLSPYDLSEGRILNLVEATSYEGSRVR
jgi:translation initiation factor IF-1